MKAVLHEGKRPVVRESGRYVYCMIRSPGEKKSFGNIGFGGSEVYTLDFKDMASVVSDSEMKKYEVNDEEVETHKKVIKQVMGEYSVIPVAYGMAFKNKKLVTIAMSAGYKAIKKAMKDVDNKVELGVKVFLPKDSPGPDNKDQYKNSFLESLKCKAAQSKVLKSFSDRMLLNASFLIDKDKIGDFSEAVEHLSNGDSGMKVQYSGPWPPYNFVDIHILSKRRGGFR